MVPHLQTGAEARWYRGRTRLRLYMIGEVNVVKVVLGVCVAVGADEGGVWRSWQMCL